jgi:excinuclease ABC subunit C
MPIQDLKAQIMRLPEQPGVYLYANRGGDTIYVGKARSLRDRVRSYLGARGASPKTDALLDEAEGLEVIVTDSVVEALALENHLIKERSPKYNILLRDDKTYPYLQLTTREGCPRVLVARRVERDGNVYAGPFMPAALARRTMALTHRLFGIRSCNEVINGRRGRPCLEYDIKRCIAPCVESLCPPEKYQQAVDHTRLFLEGRNDELLARLAAGMQEAAEGERFEEAAHLRDAARTVQALRDRQQKIATPRLGDRDVFGLHVGPAGAVVHVFLMRGGRVIERVELATDAGHGPVNADAEVLQASVEQFYEERSVPAEVHLPAEPEDRQVLDAWLSARAARRVDVLVPKRGEKRDLVNLVSRNALVAYQSRIAQSAAVPGEALEKLRVVLSLRSLPRRIEGFDVSTIQGSETVASMVVCSDGRMRRSDYRKFRITRLELPRARQTGGGGRRRAGEFGSDDVGAMYEVVLRRYRKLLEQGGPFPDLVLIDGGTGQLAAAYAALEELGLVNLVAIGLAKKEELIYTRDRAEAMALDAGDPALLLLQRIRDEAHRFAVGFHRHARAMRDLRSGLDAVPGIGPGRRRVLLTTFGSVAGVRRATREELAAVVGARTADQVLAYFAALT